MPAEIIVLKASSTEISKSFEDSGTKVYQPVVGFGVVGIKILSSFSSKSGCKEGPTLPVTKPTLYNPSRGYSTKTTLLNLLDLLLKNVSSNCLKFYKLHQLQEFLIKYFPNSSNHLPTKFCH